MIYVEVEAPPGSRVTNQFNATSLAGKLMPEARAKALQMHQVQGKCPIGRGFDVLRDPLRIRFRFDLIERQPHHLQPPRHPYTTIGE